MRSEHHTRFDRIAGWPVDGERGFALILTISLLTFLILLLVTLAALTKIEFEVDRNSQAHARARQNALLGLDTAIGQLQRYAGPDQRVTARAEILDGDPATPRVDEDGIASPTWTGVWDSSSTGGDPLTWLVSGNEDDSAPRAFVPTVALAVPAFDNENIWLLNSTVYFDSGFNIPEVDPRVIVERIPVNTDDIPGLGPSEVATIGHYAYWVGDEGLKASIQSIRPLDSSNNSHQAWDQQRRPRVGYEDVFPAITGPGSAATIDSLEKLLSYHQLAFVDSITRANLRRRIHDATVSAYSVIVDTAAGGLKTDLSDPAKTDPLSAWLQLAPPAPDPDPTKFEFHDNPFDWRGIDEGDIAPGPLPLLAPVVSEVEILIEFDFPDSGIDEVSATVEIELWNPHGAELNSVVQNLHFELRNLPDFTISHDDPLIEIDLDTISTLTFGSSETSIPGKISVFGGWKTLRGEVINLFGTDPPFTTGTKSPRDALGNIIDVVGESKITVKPQIGDLPVELWAWVGDDVSSDPLFVKQVWGVPGGSDNLGEVHYWRLNCRLIDPSSFDETDPYPDPRQFSLTDRSDGSVGDPFLITESIDNIAAPPSTFDSWGDLLTVGDERVLFDLPVWPNHSVGLLQHMFEQPASAGDNLEIHRHGNAYGGDASNALDQFFFSNLDYGATPTADFSSDSLDGTDFLHLIHPPDGSLPTNLEVQTNPASHFLVSSAFNINSTSFEAWRAVLAGAHFGAAWYYLGASSVTSTTLNRGFFRLSHTGSNIGAGYSSDPSVNSWIQGVREIDVAGQIDELARNLIVNIKANGPFGSITDFAASGIFEQAIEAVGSNPDNDSNTNPTDTPVNPAGLPYFATTRLTQADILGNLAPFISARSDTFLIRSYGDAVNPITGMTESRAWCEAIVQRLPQYVDPILDDPWEAPTPGSDNETFGRRFEIVFFRWLSRDDI